VNRFNPFRKRRYKIPGMLSTLLKIGTISSQGERSRREMLDDVYITPPLNGYTLFDFDKGREMVEVGYQSAKEALSEWITRKPGLRSDLFCE
jgi:predicted acylesterase/phospholipase RssA